MESPLVRRDHRSFAGEKNLDQDRWAESGCENQKDWFGEPVVSRKETGLRLYVGL